MMSIKDDCCVRETGVSALWSALEAEMSLQEGWVEESCCSANCLGFFPKWFMLGFISGYSQAARCKAIALSAARKVALKDQGVHT